MATVSKEKREKITEFIVKFIGKFIPDDTHNVTVTRGFLSSLSDTDFYNYIHSLRKRPATERSDQNILPYYAPNLNKDKLYTANAFKIADELEHKFHKRVWTYNPKSDIEVLSNEEFPIVDLIVRRPAQIHEKKTSIPLETKSVDDMTEQVTGASKGSKVSYPELQGQSSQGLDNTIIEEIKLRGGDSIAYREFERQMLENGHCDIDSILEMNTKTKAPTLVSILLTGAHIGNNL